MSSPLALSVEEVRRAYEIGMSWPAVTCWQEFTKELNAAVESKRQSYMSTDRAREQYDDDLKVST